jgi:hypothetical protein
MSKLKPIKDYLWRYIMRRHRARILTVFRREAVLFCDDLNLNKYNDEQIETAIKVFGMRFAARGVAKEAALQRSLQQLIADEMPNYGSGETLTAPPTKEVERQPPPAVHV